MLENTHNRPIHDLPVGNKLVSSWESKVCHVIYTKSMMQLEDTIYIALEDQDCLQAATNLAYRDIFLLST